MEEEKKLNPEEVDVNQQPEATPEEIEQVENGKIQFPITGAILIGVLALCIVICIIVILVLENK